MSHSALIKFSPVLTAERWSNPRWTRPDRTFYWNGALKLIPGQKTPVVIDHDMERTVGVVHELFTMEWTDGPWICARATLDDPPGWLRHTRRRHRSRAGTFTRLRTTTAGIA